MKIVVAQYDNLARAERALRDLRELGIPRDQINFVAGGSDESYREYFDAQGRYMATAAVDPDRDAGTPGAAIAGLGGTVLGFAMLSIPGIGPILAAGPLLAGVAGGGAGAASQDLDDVLTRSGIPAPQSERYLECIRHGGSLLLVTVEEGLLQRVEDILERHKPVHDVAAPRPHAAPYPV
jgi:hypothetical protein